jgi:hypothetical protein
VALSIAEAATGGNAAHRAGSRAFAPQACEPGTPGA